MSNVLMCDGCGKLIDDSRPYYVVSGIKQHVEDGGPIVDQAAVTLDFHDGCLPWDPETDQAPKPPADVPLGPPVDTGDVPLGPAEEEDPPQ